MSIKLTLDENKVTVERNDKFGRFLVAKRDLSAGETALEDLPLVVGPPALGPSLCLACLQRLKPPFRRCGKCSAPICCQKCEDNSNHVLECSVLSNDKDLFGNEPFGGEMSPLLQAVLPIRCFILLRSQKEEDVAASEMMMAMEAHLDERKGTPVWTHVQKAIVPVLRRLGLLEENSDEEVVQKVCGILDVNAFEIRGTFQPGQTDVALLRALYPHAALLAHGCIGNVQVSVDSSMRLRARTRHLITKGQTLLLNYTRALDTTPQRHCFLQEGKYFQCECNRCLDPTELSTYVSALRCTKCRTGWLLPPAPFLENCQWQCEKCSMYLPAHLADALATKVQTDLESMPPDAESLERLFQQLQRSLHPQHGTLLEIRQRLLHIYAESSREAEVPETSILNRQIQLCQELLQVADVLEPGISRFRGLLLHELQGPLVMLAHIKHEEGVISKNELAKQLREAEGLLTVCVRLLIYEPPGTPEGFLARAAMENLRQLRTYLQAFK